MKRASEIKTGERVKVHIFDMCGREIKTNDYGKIFPVVAVGESPAIEWNTERDPLMCGGAAFVPLSAFVDDARRVGFEIV